MCTFFNDLHQGLHAVLLYVILRWLCIAGSQLFSREPICVRLDAMLSLLSLRLMAFAQASTLLPALHPFSRVPASFSVSS